MSMSILPLEEWRLPMAGIFLCAGPCSAESREQLLRTAEGLAGCELSFFRAGVWKPRTRPGSFSGVGAEALEWLVEVRREYGFPVGAEVGTAEHVEAALRAGLDVVWIGARTSPDPFAVQAIADALAGTDLAVLVKNPVSADLSLWLGALERVAAAGIRRLAAVHRGFSSATESRYRNAPFWRIPIELKRRVPELPLICDPSHMTGRAEMVFPTAQEALDLLYDGLMVEVHCDPPRALSDARQQLTPQQFRRMVDELVVRKEAGQNGSFEAELLGLRHRVDEIDEGIIDLLSRRMEVVAAMGRLKHRHRISTLQPRRWEEILTSRTAAGRRRGLDEKFLTQLYQLIHEEAIRRQEEPLFGRAGESAAPPPAAAAPDEPR
ncbi:MAG: bifunctional 3-deoxy-7-phosphoheptulonate synthase/chorismate mutase type II [Planctomycetes bacterium]|nr:bifunctional 3-deoxy-7-phosphoheptulonate synthase/chorismate mutase type II [Planctomycetota bacterium]